MISKYRPKELLVNSNISNSNLKIIELKEIYDIAVTEINDSIYSLDKLKNKEFELLDILLKNIDNYNEIKNTNVIFSSIAAYFYVRENQKNELSHLEKIYYLHDESYMYLDSATIKNLELIENNNYKDRKGTLLDILDDTKTAMGGRLLRRMVEEPLKNYDLILYRQEAVKDFLSNEIELIDLRENLNAIYDLERIVTRIDMKHANAKDLIAFKNSIYILPYVKSILNSYKSKFAIDVASKFDTLKDLYTLVDIKLIVKGLNMVGYSALNIL